MTSRLTNWSQSQLKGKGKGFPYSTPSVGPGADPGVQAVSLQVTASYPPGGRLPLLSATFNDNWPLLIDTECRLGHTMIGHFMWVRLSPEHSL